MPRGAKADEEWVELETIPRVVEDSQAAVIERIMKLDLLGGEEVLAFEGSGDELAGLWRQIGDIADGAGARPLGGAKGFANEVREVSLAGLPGGLSDLHEHGLHSNRTANGIARYISNTVSILLATHFAKSPANLMFWLNSLGS